MIKKALITGVTGQTGSYFCELLLEDVLNEVYGLYRRSSQYNFNNLQHCIKNKRFHLLEGDISDFISISGIINYLKPDYIVNFAAQSHVHTSFEQPVFTFHVNMIGVLNILESIRKYSPHTKLVQLSSSEQFGSNYRIDEYGNKIQDELVAFHPRSPYAVSKVAAHNLCINYREAYNLDISCAICFNNESVPGYSPIILKSAQDDILILPISDLFIEHHNYKVFNSKYLDYQVWDGVNWTNILGGTCYYDPLKRTKKIHTHTSSCEVTYNHSVFLYNNDEVLSQKIDEGDILYPVKYPYSINNHIVDENLAKFLGFYVHNGYINIENKVEIQHSNIEILYHIYDLISSKFNGTLTIEQHNDNYHLIIDNSSLVQWLLNNVYTLHFHEKCIPFNILNSNNRVKQSFLEGYFLSSCHSTEVLINTPLSVESATLCLGLIFLFQHVYLNKHVYIKYRNNKYYILVRRKHHSMINKYRVVSTKLSQSYDKWYYDISTESQAFATGAGLCKIHNSPRRGLNFVTRKITNWIGANYLYLHNKQSPPEPLVLGNLNAYRDWSHSKDICRAIKLILYSNIQDDFVICSGKTYTISEFLDKAFRYINISDWSKYVKTDPKFYRPSDVEYLCGKHNKIKNLLGWFPIYTLEDIIKDMVDYDIMRYRNDSY